MLTVTADEFRSLPEGTLFTYDGSDIFVRHAIFEKGVDVPMTSNRFSIYGKDDLKKLQAQVEFALGLIGHRAPEEEAGSDEPTDLEEGEAE